MSNTELKPLEYRNYAGLLATFTIDGPSIRVEIRRGLALFTPEEAREIASWLQGAAAVINTPED